MCYAKTFLQVGNFLKLNHVVSLLVDERDGRVLFTIILFTTVLALPLWGLAWGFVELIDWLNTTSLLDSSLQIETDYQFNAKVSNLT